MYYAVSSQGPFKYWRKVVPGRGVTRPLVLPLASHATFHLFPQKKWRIVYMRKKKLVPLKG